MMGVSVFLKKFFRQIFTSTKFLHIRQTPESDSTVDKKVYLATDICNILSRIIQLTDRGDICKSESLLDAVSYGVE